MKIMAVSDMHGNLEGLDPSGADVVVIAGDFGIMKGWGLWHMNDQVKWINRKFAPWCAAHPEITFCVVPGNHDLFAQHPEVPTKVVRPANVHFLVDRMVEVKGLKIAGVPWVPRINGSWAFEAEDEAEMARRFAWVPEGVDVLITHSPPRLEGRQIDCSVQTGDGPFGSKAITEAIARAKPQVVFCGHIHSGAHGVHDVVYPGGWTKVYNVSRVDERYEIAYEPTWIDVSPRKDWVTMKIELDDKLAEAMRQGMATRGMSLAQGVLMALEELVKKKDIKAAARSFAERFNWVAYIKT